jgi:hypothetical protein
MKFILLFSLFIMPIVSVAQMDTAKKETEKKAHWYDKVAIRGYMQARYNRLLETNPKLKNEQGDKSWGEHGGLFIRRMRIIIYGQVHERVFIYIQPDLASSPSSTVLHYAQLRDAYLDLGLDKKNEFRLRLGQSKVPFGFENMQSSQNRVPLDRNDALNSAVSNERDMAAFFYWAPSKVRKLYAQLVSDGLKGSGDYGVFGGGVYNGQTANKPELNDELHAVARLTYPFRIGNQIIEPGIQGYTGHFVIPTDQLTAGVKTIKDRNYLDQRAAASFILYPQPFGIQAEYNIGKGPEFNKLTDSIEVRNLKGGYATLTYLIKYKKQTIIPFLRMHTYQGGKKQETDARSYNVNEIEPGIEWQPIKNFELTVMYTMSERRFEDFKVQNNFQSGNLLRIQAQLNF